MMRYLTHMDDTKKHQYSPDEVMTNSTPYSEVVRGALMTDKEVIDAVLQSKEFDLIGVVPMTRIRLAQSLVHNRRLANAEQLLTTMREQNNLLSAQVEKMSLSIDRIDSYFTHMITNLTSIGTKAQESIVKIAEEIKKARLKVR